RLRALHQGGVRGFLQVGPRAQHLRARGDGSRLLRGRLRLAKCSLRPVADVPDELAVFHEVVLQQTGEILRRLADDDQSRAAQLRSEEHTSELQSRFDLVCRLLLEKKK